MVQASSSNKNLWVASSDGDIERVQYLIESEGMSPNDKDSNSYTPMHAASSYAHLELLTYLLSKGGDINIPDDDGETPLFVVETLEAARFLVQHGADVSWKNEDGLTAAEQLEEDHPQISSYLYSLLPADQQPRSQQGAGETGEGEGEGEGINQMALENFTTEQSEYMMREAEKIMRACAETGEEPDEKLKELVEGIVKDGLNFGREAQEQLGATSGSAGAGGRANGVNGGEDSKRIREE
ncbi:uncharacterized protein I303_103717 [Kwoniella dejecticola CBS 10117]|uniref:Uncharacterized protein n=1 Tax=Kwoniella dejecticola CBS 10117 TaxID=1296121 RepID=A0A1A6A7I3_9TREE|nr:uncharacterized protein I303_03734 [Kwoniella dejecticola CBS 10117]OBR86017.1 hypothetical protein I303_03734 [Kwoniella dejecticola CBS 10117]